MVRPGQQLIAFVAVSAAMLLLLVDSARADNPTEFIRVAEDDGRARALQLGIVTYVGSGISVDLVGAIHIGDPSYYSALNDVFTRYDVLLYEMVAPDDMDVGQIVDRRKGLLSSTQTSMANMLDLSFQLDEIDYEPGNFVRADLTPGEFSAAMAARDESFYTYFWRIVFASIAEYRRDPLGLANWKMLSSMVTDRDDMSFKTSLAYQLTDFGAMQEIFGDDADSTIVGARNERAIEVLQEQIDAGAEHIGIFFGVAHMPDLEMKLLDNIGLTYEKTVWIDAWQLSTHSESTLTN